MSKQKVSLKEYLDMSVDERKGAIVKPSPADTGIRVLAKWKDDRCFGSLLGQRASGEWEVLLDDASTTDLPLDHLIDFHENLKACAVDEDSFKPYSRPLLYSLACSQDVFVRYSFSDLRCNVPDRMNLEPIHFYGWKIVHKIDISDAPHDAVFEIYHHVKNYNNAKPGTTKILKMTIYLKQQTQLSITMLRQVIRIPSRLLF
jgi:hypothetical protein